MSDESKKSIQEEAGLPPNWVPVDRAPVDPSRPPAPPQANDQSNYYQTSISPSFQHDTSFVGTQYGSPTVPKTALMPLGVQANPVSNAAVQSTVTKVIENGSAQAIELETNSSPNPKQDVLNLRAGTNITLQSDNAGGVTITGAASGDGLVHGNSIWDVDSAVTFFRDDFLFGSNTSGAIGDMGWNFVSIGSAGGLAIAGNPNGLPFTGNVLLVSNSTAVNAAGAIALPGVAGGFFNVNHASDGQMALLDFPGWTATFVFGFTLPDPSSQASGGPAFNTTHLSMYVGLAQTSQGVGSGVRPQVFFGARFDTDTSAPSIGDTTIVLEACINPAQNTYARNNAQGTNGGTFNTGLVPAVGKMYRLDISYLTVGTMTMSITDGSTTQSHTFTVTQNSTLVNGGGFAFLRNSGVLGFPTQGLGTWFTPGSKMTVTGLSGGNTPLNSTWRVLEAGGAVPPNVWIIDPGVGTGGSPGTYTITGYPALSPTAIFGNDSIATAPGTNTRGLLVDFIALTENNGISSGAPSPTPTKVRYW